MTKDNEKEEDIREEVEVPNIEGLTIKEAEKVLSSKYKGTNVLKEIEELDKENIIVKNQVPNAGIMVNKGSKIDITY